MQPALWVSKTGLDAQQTNIATISNNLANASTIGFKKGRAVFEDLFYQNINQPGAQSSQNTRLPSGLMLGAALRSWQPKRYTRTVTYKRPPTVWT